MAKCKETPTGEKEQQGRGGGDSFFVLFRAQRDYSGGTTLSRAQRDHAGGTTYSGGVFRGKQDPTRERLCSRGPMRERKDEAICRGGCNKEK